MEIKKRNYLKTILITGGTGLIGTNLLKKLKLNKKYKIYIITREKKIESKKIQSRNIEYINQDLTSGIKTKIKNLKVDIVVHLAGRTFSNKVSIKEYHSKNIVTTINILKSINNKIEKFIFLSSQYVYGNVNSKNIKENTILDSGFSHYGKSKIECEKIIKKFTKKIKNIIILRSCGLIEGGGIIEYLKIQIKNNKKILLYGNGEIIRDYISINDLVELIKKIIKKNFNKKIIIANIGSKKIINTKQIALLISKNLNKNLFLLPSKDNKALPNTKLNIEFAKKIFGYNPKSFNHSLRIYLKKK